MDSLQFWENDHRAVCRPVENPQQDVYISKVPKISKYFPLLQIWIIEILLFNLLFHF